MLEPSGGGGVAGGRVQVGAFGFQPGGCLPGRGQHGGTQAGCRPGGKEEDAGSSDGEVLAGGQRGVQVVVQQPAGRGVAISWVVGGGEGAGVLAEQVVQPVAAGGGLGEQVLVIQLIEAAAGLIQLVSSSAAAAWASKSGPGTRPRRRNSRCWPG